MSWNNVLPWDVLTKINEVDAADAEERIIADYLRRNPKPAYKEDPPLKTRLDDQTQNEESEVDDIDSE